MTHIVKNALVMHTPAQMYKLVNDVERYPDFLPWCRSSRVLERGQGRQRATIEIAKGPLNKTFTTLNTLQEPHSIQLRLEAGPFKSLDGRWAFEALGEKGCKISMDIEFEFSGRLMRAVLNPVFSDICSTLVDAFVKRADQIYKR